MNKVKKLISWNAFPALLLFVIFLGINGIMTGGLSVSFFRSFISTNAGAICVAIGVTATILVAGTDISLGSIVSLVNVVIVTAFEKGFSVPQAATLGLLSALLCGMFNGFIVGVMRINPLLATLLRLQLLQELHCGYYHIREAILILALETGIWVICLGLFQHLSF